MAASPAVSTHGFSLLVSLVGPCSDLCGMDFFARLIIGTGHLRAPRPHRCQQLLPAGCCSLRAFSDLFGFYIVVSVFYVYVFLVQFTSSPPHLPHVSLRFMTPNTTTQNTTSILQGTEPRHAPRRGGRVSPCQIVTKKGAIITVITVFIMC